MSNLDDATLFGAVADVYHEARPPTPPETFAWLTKGDLRDVLDVAAGTGRFTEPLVARRPWIPRVHAVEPDARMLLELERRCPAVLAQLGRAEAIPLSGDSIDAVFAADAFQWFDPHSAWTEIARVLRPGGTLGAVWNQRDGTVPWLAGLEDLLPQKRQWPGDMPGVFSVPANAPFTAPERYDQTWTWSIPMATFVESLGTYSSMLSLPDDETRRRLVAAQCYLDEVLDHMSVVDVQIRTIAYRTQLVGS